MGPLPQRGVTLWCHTALIMARSKVECEREGVGGGGAIRHFGKLANVPRERGEAEEGDTET